MLWECGPETVEICRVIPEINNTFDYDWARIERRIFFFWCVEDTSTYQSPSFLKTIMWEHLILLIHCICTRPEIRPFKFLPAERLTACQFDEVTVVAWLLSFINVSESVVFRSRLLALKFWTNNRIHLQNMIFRISLHWNSPPITEPFPLIYMFTFVRLNLIPELWCIYLWIAKGPLCVWEFCVKYENFN